LQIETAQFLCNFLELQPTRFRLTVCMPVGEDAPVNREARILARQVYRRYRLPAGCFEPWLSRVADVGVEIHPNGRAILRHPVSTVPVEIRFDADLGAVAVHLVASPGEPLPSVEVPISECVAALELARQGVHPSTLVVTVTGTGRVRLRSRAVGGAVARPSSGQRPPLEFYRDLVAEYDELVHVKAVRNPIAEIARRRRQKPATVKSWLHRGRKYLKRETGK
jgi:hypothetical protein